MAEKEKVNLGYLRTVFPKDIIKTMQELKPVSGITKRKLDKLVSSVYNVDVKDISRAVLTSLKKGGALKSCNTSCKRGAKLSTDFKTGLCGSIGGNNCREDDPLKKCQTRNDGSERSRNGGCPERRSSSQGGCGGGKSSSLSRCGRGKSKKRQRTRSRSSRCSRKKKKRRSRRNKSCSKKGKRRSRSRGRSRKGSKGCKKKRRRSRKRSKGCKKKRRRSRRSRSRSCGPGSTGGCKLRHGRKPCRSSKCKSRGKRRSRSRSRKGGSCGARGAGGCQQRHGRKPCKSSKCKSKRRRSKRRRGCSKPRTCGPVTVIYPPTVPILNNKVANEGAKGGAKDQLAPQAGFSEEPYTSGDSSTWYIT